MVSKVPVPLPLFLSLALLVQPEEPQWKGFRGTEGRGSPADSGYPATLAPATNLKWRVAVPAGYSSPAIAGGRVFLTGAREAIQDKEVSGELVTLCLDAATGETRWRHELEFSGAVPGMNSCAAPSPATDGVVVVAFFHHFGLLAFDLEGKELWRRPMGPFLLPHGMASSPLVEDGLVVIQVDQNEGSFLAAFDKLSGAERWRVERPEVGTGYASPIAYRPAEGPVEVVTLSALQVASFALASGEKLWWLDGPSRQPKGAPFLLGGRCYVKSFMRPLSERHIVGLNGNFAEVLAEHDANQDQKLARPEFPQARLQELWPSIDQDGDELLDAAEWELALANATGGLFAITLGGKGDVTASHLAWKVDDRRTLVGLTTPVIVDRTMFLLGEGGLLTSLDIADGKIRKQERVGEPDQYIASPVTADGRLYVVSLSGLLSVVQATPDWKVLSTHALDEVEIWATPALAGRAVFVRSKEALCCFADPD